MAGHSDGKFTAAAADEPSTSADGSRAIFWSRKQGVYFSYKSRSLPHPKRVCLFVEKSGSAMGSTGMLYNLFFLFGRFSPFWSVMAKFGKKSPILGKNRPFWEKSPILGKNLPLFEKWKKISHLGTKLPFGEKWEEISQIDSFHLIVQGAPGHGLPRLCKGGPGWVCAACDPGVVVHLLQHLHLLAHSPDLRGICAGRSLPDASLFGGHSMRSDPGRAPGVWAPAF
jgi:hypothetical protein